MERFNINTVKISLDTQSFDLKPNEHETAKISNRIASCPAKLTIEDLARQLVQPNGKTFTPAIFKDGKRSNQTWEGQSVFGLDFDTGITLEQFLERCKKYGVTPAFVYSTFSSTNNDKFRAVFQTPCEITKARFANLVQLALMGLFPEADKQCKDRSRIFFGGKTLIYEDYSAVVDVDLLIHAFSRYHYETDPVNAARTIKTFCTQTGVDMVNGRPKIEKRAIPKLKILGAVLYIIYRFAHNFFKLEGGEALIVAFNGQATEQNFRADKPSKIAIDNQIIERHVEEHVDFCKMKKECAFYRDFISGTYWAYRNQIFGLATNLLAAKGGRQWLMQGIDSRPEYDKTKWKYQANDINKRNYLPQQCKNFCPPEYFEQCQNSGNILQMVRQPRGTVYELQPRQTKPLKDAERELAEVFQKALNAKDNKIYVIKAPTGIGKTELYLPLRQVTIAVPTHNLKDDVSRRMMAAGVSHLVSPRLPGNMPLELEQKIVSLYAKGAIQAVRKELKAHSLKDKDIEDYLLQSRAIEDCNQTLITTHERLFYHDDLNEIIISDEDIMPSMLKIDAVSIRDGITLSTSIRNIHDAEILQDLIAKMKFATPGMVYEMPSFKFGTVDEIINTVAHSQNITSNVLGFLSCTHFIKPQKDKNSVSYIMRRELPNKKIIIMSATANEALYRSLSGDRLEFIDIGHVETKGKIIQYPEYSFSRYQMTNDKKFLDIAKKIVGKNPVITFKDFAHEFPNCIATFGNLSGLNKFSGLDIHVVGTPHCNPIAYMLIANALGYKPRLEDDQMRYAAITYNGLRFHFQTFSNNEVLQQIQLHVIVAELMQAIGRARILREDCTVTVLSNMPIPGAQYKSLDQFKDSKGSEIMPITA